MNYYPFHMGDYMAHTAHLDQSEDLAYRRMLDLYYLRECSLPEGIDEIARLIRMRDQLDAVASVLREFFTQDESGGWVNARCAQELERMQDKQAKARASAAASVKARSTNAQRTLNERSTDAELPTPTPTPTPILPSEVVSGAAQSATPTPAPPFDGQNAELLNGKSVVALAPHWELPESWGLDAEALGWKSGEVLKEAEKFRQYWVSGRGTGTRRSVRGWRQTWSTWLEKAARDHR